MKNSILILLTLFSLSSCQENPLGKTQVGANFHPGLKAPPKILSVSPNQGPFVGGTNITLTGTGFTEESKIKIGGIACSAITFYSPTRIVCLTPQHSIGSKDVYIENKDAQKHTLLSAFAYVTNVSATPGFGIVSGGGKRTSLGSSFSGETMTGATTQLKVGVGGILFDPSEN